MFTQSRKTSSLARVLTLCVLLCSSACTTLFQGKPNSCKSRAYVSNHLGDYIRTRFPKGAPVRLAIIPFGAPANVSAQNIEMPGMGNTVAWKLRDELLASGEIPIVEVFNRQDWPGKKEEFPLGNFEAIRQAMVADYDLLMVGSVEPFTSMNKMAISFKVMEIETSTTIYSGRTEVYNSRAEQERRYSRFYMLDRTPANLPIEDMQTELAACVATELFADEVLPEAYR